jgi:hypothetical protein
MRRTPRCRVRSAAGGRRRFFNRATAERRKLSGQLRDSFSVDCGGGSRLGPRFPASSKATSTSARPVLVWGIRLRSDQAQSSRHLGNRERMGRTLRTREARAIRSANRNETGGRGSECATTGAMAREAASMSGRSTTRTERTPESPGSSGSQRPIKPPANVNPASSSDAAVTTMSADLTISIPLIVSPQHLGWGPSCASCQWVGRPGHESGKLAAVHFPNRLLPLPDLASRVSSSWLGQIALASGCRQLAGCRMELGQDRPGSCATSYLPRRQRSRMRCSPLAGGPARSTEPFASAVFARKAGY